MERLEQIKSKNKSVLHSKGSNAMKRSIFLIIKTALLLVLFSNNAFSQGGAPTTQGKEFWVAFGQNSNHPPGNVSLQVRIVATKTTEVTFSYMNNSSYNQTFTVAAGQVYTHNLSTEEKALVYNRPPTGTTNRSLYITSDEDVSVYAINLRSASTDATIVLPTSNYGTSYYALSYAALSGDFDGYTIIANEDGTEIKEDGTVVEMLDRGQVYSYYLAISDLTGRNITSNKPFAMFTTNTITNVAIGSADCLFEQLVPVNSWGNTFLVPVAYSVNNANLVENNNIRDRDRVRILSSQDGTTITQTGGTIITGTGGVNTLASPINAGQFVELEINIADGGCFINSNKPVAVASYLMGGNNFTGSPRVGDPAMAWIPPLEQTVSVTAIAPFFAGGGLQSILQDNHHYALIVTPTATKNDTRVSIGAGTPQSLSGGTWVDNAGSGYSFYTMNFPSGNKNATYFIENPAGMIVLGYGLGYAESYYYLAASAARNLEAAFYVNDVHYQDIDGQSFCDNSVTLRAEVQFPMSATAGRLKWYIDGSEALFARDALQFNTPILAVGSHSIKMVALSVDGEEVEVQTTITVSGSMTSGSIGSDQSIASGATAAALTSTTLASGGAGTITYQWQSSTDNSTWTDIAGATNGSTYSPGTLTATTYYRRAATSDCGTVYTASVQITVTAVGADIITVTGATSPICSGDAASLTASANSVTSPVFRWYSAATGGTLLHTGDTYSPSPSTTTIYYVSVSGTSQAESSRKAVTVTVTPRSSSSMIKVQ